MISETIAEWEFNKSIFDILNEKIECKIRMYVLEGMNFAKRDLLSESDPYLLIKCGKIEFNEQQNYQLDEPNPKFYKCFEFMQRFPGAPVISISAYDYDDFFGDDLIGETKIDLNDRFYNKDWTSIVEKPIESRSLYMSTSRVPQGNLRLWLEIIPMFSKRMDEEIINIAPEPEEEYEMRFIVWKTKKIEMMDFEGTSDVYCKSSLNRNDEYVTDTHWRCTTGDASFNWRNLIKVKANSVMLQQNDNYNLTIQAWDKDLIGGDDLIGDFKLDLQPIVSDMYLTKRAQVLNKKYWNDYMKKALEERGFKNTDDIKWEDDECFWIPVSRLETKEDGTKGEEKNSGYILVSLRIFTKDFAEKQPQGKGRDAPNDDPLLPPPEGRLELTLNPFKMFSQLLGPAVRRKICILLFCVVCCALLIYMAPMIISNGISKVIFN